MAETVQQVLRERAEDDTAGVKHPDGEQTWREHCATAQRQAAALIGLLDDARPAHVAVLLGNTPEMLEAMAGAGLAGYVLVGINTTRRGPGLVKDVLKSHAQVLLEAHKLRVERDDYNIAPIHLADAIELMVLRSRESLSTDRTPKDPYKK